MRELWASTAVETLALVLVSAGVAKLTRGPSALRGLQGAAEILLAAAALVAPVRITAAALAATFAAFAVVHARHRDAHATQDCACFGEPSGLSGPAGGRRLALTAASAGLAAVVAAVAGDARAPLLALVDHPLAGAVALIVAGLAAQAWRLAFTTSARSSAREQTSQLFAPSGTVAASRPHARPASERLVTSSAQFLERRFSRRGLLVRVAAVGSALTVAPLRYLLYPGTALAAITPGECHHGACTDGYTAFCCEINHGQNSCPTGTFAGGWWMCTDYPGRKLCADAGVRYYVDCNALPGHPFPGGCRCAGSTCDERRVACNVFRYGQCNTEISGVTAVVCRMVVCENPSTISELGCSASLAVDNAVCHHEAGCLDTGTPVGAPGGV